MNRVVIGGLPRTGKTTLAVQMRRLWPENALLRHTDDLIATHTWSLASLEVCDWFDFPGPWIIEGVTVSRALRKWHYQHPDAAPPIDRCIYLTKPYELLTPGQEHLASAVATIHAEIRDWLCGSVLCV